MPGAHSDNGAWSGMSDDARVRASLRLDDDLSGLRFMNPTRLRALNSMGLATVRDLVYNPPRRYVDFTQISPIATCVIGQKATVLATVDECKERFVRKGMRILNVSFVDESGAMMGVWFNQPWMARMLKQGARVIAQGTVEHRGGFKQMNSPEVMVLDEGDETTGIRPVYKRVRGITTGWVKRYVKEALEGIGPVVDPLPARIRIERGLMSRHCALRAIHEPSDMDEREAARRRLSYEELLLLQLHWLMERAAAASGAETFRHVSDGPLLARFRESLPFPLTDDQERALREILADMASDQRMNRMLLGDVGTGKTVVAAGALAAVADSGTQGVLMAPTEVLARQYGAKIGPMLDAVGITWATLTATTPGEQRRTMLEGLAIGHLQVLFATHAVLEDDVVFANLTLAIVDEQHRFGVAQREKLRAKGPAADYLCMTATPIPRSLALTLYGNLECSYIRQRPGGNREIETKVMEKRNRFAAFDEIRAAVDEGRQAYIICPLIGEASKPRKAAKGEDDEDEPDAPVPLDERALAELGEDLKAARQEAEYLQSQVFPNMRIGLLCGGMPAKEKTAVMEDFRDGKIDVLVSTTVVEVGVDVPNATVMVIEDAERFGLSQLHQLRGRVGRGEHPGKALLLASTKTDVSSKRMEYIQKTQDGFELAELDLSLRREGDVVGSRQHGDTSLRYSNIVRDAATIELARADAQRILADDPLLAKPVNALLAHEVAAVYPE